MKFYPQMNSLFLDSLINSIQDDVDTTWATGQLYQASTIIISNNIRYVALNKGISGIFQPTHLSGISSDGGIRWLYIGQNTKSNTFIKNLYLSIGQTTAWDNELSPPIPNINYSNRKTTLNDIITLQKINNTDVVFGILKNQWISTTIYNKYDPTQTQTNTYITVKLTNNTINVYRCLDNNNGAPSTVKPTAIQTNNVITSDGYVWKFLYNIDYETLSKFETDTFFPIKHKKIDEINGNISSVNIIAQQGNFNPLSLSTNIPFGFTTNSTSGSGLSLDCTIHNTVESVRVINGGKNYNDTDKVLIYRQGSLGSGAILTPILTAGSITGFNIVAGGSNYVNAQIIIVGNGSSCLVHPVIVSGSITNVVIDNPGIDYTNAVAYVLPGTAGAVGEITMSPFSGHGYNIIKELNLNTLIINTILDGNSPYYSDYLDVDFRQICIITDILHQDNTISNSKNLLGKNHSKYILTNNFKKMKELSGTLLYIDNIIPTRLTSNESLQIKITISL